MPLFKFVGDGVETVNKNHSMLAFGYEFTGEQPTEVDDSHAIAKLRGNGHFEEVAGVSKPSGFMAYAVFKKDEDGQPGPRALKVFDFEAETNEERKAAAEQWLIDNGKDPESYGVFEREM